MELQVAGKDDNFTKRVDTGIQGSARRKTLDALKKYTLYEIKMRTVNPLGVSPYSPVIRLMTQEYGMLYMPQSGGGRVL